MSVQEILIFCNVERQGQMLRKAWKMAGMPQYVIQKANKMLKKLEESHNVVPTAEVVKNAQKEMQLSFFDMNDPLLEALKEDLLSLDINTLTPVEALMKLNEMRKRIS